jgi:hypothetical protein
VEAPEKTCVVVIRAWPEARGLRSRVLVDASPERAPEELVAGSLDELLELVRAYLVDRFQLE